ncbi:DBH-like monooxygenase protein 2 homolog [Tubulanus polymorphus]|uniref:DBH-like monooxygenase protein 2 homolog n=1 Tax=Tubulanus polymorphus TaxID=672921 RepID=UPI003DA45D69
MISTIKGDEKKQLNLFSVMHHAHLAARAMRTRHFRNGVELPWVMNDETYDFNFQTFRPVKKVVAVKSGDWLTIDCVYNTTDRSNVTFADYASTSEMCLSFISYYPKVPFGFCTTMLDAPKVTNFIWDTKGKDVREFLEAPSTWKDPIANKRFQELTLAADPLQRKNCFTSDLQPSSAYKPWKYEPKKEYKPIENKNTCSQKEVTVKRTQPSVSKKGETVSKPSIPKDKSPSGKAGSSESTPTKIHSHVDASFPRRVYVDPDKKYLLEWKYNRGQPGSNNGSITFRVTVKTTGYVGFGLSRNGGMKGADIVIGWVHHGKAQIYDTHGVGNSIPKLDKVANWKLLNGKEENGFTQLTFSRDLDTCDDEGDIPIQPGTQRMIYAYGGDVDPVDVTKALYHGGANRGVMSYYLLDDPQPSFPPGSDVKTLDITSPNIRLPAQKTTYLCRFVKIDLPAGKKHIIKIEQVMKPGNEKYIHHMVLWACAKGALSDRDLIRGDCFGIRNREKCFEGVAMFAQGSRSVTYPQEAGVSLGGPADSVYYMMQTHYNNPEEQSGIIDDSTIRLSYTSKLRKYDAGNMMVGSMHFLPFSLLIPPRQKRFLVRAFCSDNCLKAAFEKLGNGVNEIKVFSTGPHSHTAARGMRLRHFRNGKELPWILNDMTYDFNSQNWRPRKEFVTVKMGDVLANECYYNTEDRNRVTVGGFSTTDEMCFSMVNYFPKLPMSFCQTSPNPINALVSVWGYLKIMRMVGTDWGKVMGDLNAITDILNRDDTWDGGYDVLLQRHILTTAQNQYCTDQGVPIIKDGAWNYKISNEYRPPIKNVCNRPAKELQAFQTFTIPEAPHWYSAFFGKSFLIICIVIVLLGVLFFARHKIFTKIRSIQYRLLNKTTAYKKLEKL